MTRTARTLAMAAFLACGGAAQAGVALKPTEGDFTVRDFHFHSGETLPELRLHYTTLGAPIATRTATSTTRC